ncbi:MAG: glucose 1-dehydrogenase [Xanthomonadales bacterium]|nr:glucose 1-dehydrogenase [Gammaproteobacteria bacterium]NND56084.1 glucose 1-dehydrogenase [Xanthomonadales bacterium]NNK50215.1 glucose 1-dehydrogenase [Xanthomonadales bacterium]
MNYSDLKGKVAVVNGASRGIGEAIARGLAASGARLVLTSRSQEGVQEVADSITGAGGEAVAKACHAGNLDDIQGLLEYVRESFGRLDILINNAATNPFYGPAAGLTPEAFDKTVQVNLKGPYFLSSAAIPLMIESGGGSIVNVSSIAALNPLPGQAVYGMTKAGLISLTKAFAKEYGQQGIRVNAILPGVVKTRFAAALTEDPRVQKWISKLPVPRAGQPEDMVAGVLYLVSDQAAYTTGTTLVMDGGATLG